MKKLFTIYTDETYYIIEYSEQYREICDDDIMECLERAVRHARIVHKLESKSKSEQR